VDLVGNTSKFETDMGRAAHVAEVASRKIEGSSKRWADRIRADQAAMQRSAAGIESHFAKMGAAIGVSASAAVLAIGAMATRAVAAIDAFNDLKDATGASIENISALDAVARRTGGDFSIVETTLTKFNKVLADTKPGSEAARALEAIGLKASELKRLDPAEALLKTAIAMQGVADDGYKGRLSTILFGRSLKEIAPFLVDLAAQGKLVAKVTAEQAESAERFRKTLFELKANIDDASRAMTVALVPSINQTILRFKEGSAAGESFFATLAKMQLEAIGIDTSGMALAADRIKALTRLLEDQNLPLERRLRLEAQLAGLRAKQVNFSPAAGAGRGFVNPDVAKPSVGDIPDKPTAVKVSKEAALYLESLQKQLEKVGELTVAEQALLDIKRLDVVTPAQKAAIIATAKLVDAAKQSAKAATEEAKVQEFLAGLVDRSVQSRRGELETITAGNAAVLAEIEVIGLDTDALSRLEKQRLAGVIAAKQEQLALFERTGAAKAETDVIREQIGALKKRAGLLDRRDTVARIAEESAAIRATTDGLASSIAQGVGNAVTDFKSLPDVARAVARDIQNAFVQMTIVEPIKRQLQDVFKGASDPAAASAEASKTAAITAATTATVTSTSAIASMTAAATAAASALSAVATAPAGQGLGSLFSFGAPSGAGFGTGAGFGNLDIGQFLAEGTDRVPYDGFKAVLHKDERVVPAKFNPAIGNGGGKREPMQVVINNNAGAQVQTRETDSGGLEVIIERAAALAEGRMAAGIANGTGKGATALKSRGVRLDGGLARRG